MPLPKCRRDFGRRLRYLVWDGAHDRVAEVIARVILYSTSRCATDSSLAQPMTDHVTSSISWTSMYSTQCPYSFLLGGKAVAALVRTQEVSRISTIPTG